MRGPGWSEKDDDIQLEVTPMRPDTTASPPGGRSPLAPKRTPRQRAARAGILAAGLLVLALALGSLTGGGSLVGLLARASVTPHAAATPANNQFYLLPSPSDIVVTLDGEPLSAIPWPMLADGHPLRLSSDRHILAWHWPAFPFTSMSCVIYLAGGPTHPCPLMPATWLAGAGLPPTMQIIPLYASMISVRPEQATPLTKALQRALATIRSTTIVQPGERYYSYQLGQSGGAVVATRPLRATLTYQPAQAGYQEPCTLAGQEIIPCRYPTQDCTLLCSVPHPPPWVAHTPDVWIASANVSAAWTYTTLDGHVVAANMGEEYNMQLAMFRITWDGAAWHVAPILGHVTELPSDDLVCDPARYEVFAHSAWSTLLTAPPAGATRQFVSDATPSDGCLVILDPRPGADTPIVLLQRFGVLLAVNGAATSGDPSLPVADASERALAQRIAARAGISLP